MLHSKSVDMIHHSVQFNNIFNTSKKIIFIQRRPWEDDYPQGFFGFNLQVERISEAVGHSYCNFVKILSFAVVLC